MTRDHAQEEREAFNAFADGKSIEERINDGKAWWYATSSPKFTEDFEHRLAPMVSPPGDLTWEQAERLRQEGVALEFAYPTTTIFEDWDHNDQIKEGHAYFAFRRKPAPPTPRMVVLSQGDVSGALIRTREKPNCWRAVIWTDPEYVCFESPMDGPWVYSYWKLREECDYSRDSGKTWAKCEKEAK